MKVFVDQSLLKKSSGRISHAFRVVGSDFEASVIFTTRRGGCSKTPYSSLNLSYYVGDEEERVRQNRKAVSEFIGKEDFVTVQQAHGNGIVVLESSNVVNLKTGHIDLQADAIVTAFEGVPLGVLSADCLPMILIAEPGIVSAVHAGWRGLLAGVVENAVGVMRDLKGEDFAVFFGPSICKDCYEVGEDVVEKFRSKFKGGIYSSGGKWHLSLKTLAFEVLENIGVVERILRVGRLSLPELTASKMVYNIDVCTFESKIYYSYRREGLTGRQAGIVLLKRR